MKNRLFFIASGALLASALVVNAQESSPKPSQISALAMVDGAVPARSAVLASDAELPDSPGTALSKSQDTTQSTSTSAPSSSSPAVVQASAPAAQSPPQQNPVPQRPVGTAAAEAPVVTGVSAAQPSGFAVAPAKQRRRRSLVIKVGAVLGAGAALGTVLALSEGTSSKPPGAH